jgi:hypothetical protein
MPFSSSERTYDNSFDDIISLTNAFLKTDCNNLQYFIEKLTQLLNPDHFVIQLRKDFLRLIKCQNKKSLPRGGGEGFHRLAEEGWPVYQK